MEVELLKDNLKEGLNIIEKIAKKNINLPILNNTLLSTDGNFLRLDATNLELSVSYWLLGNIREKGKISVLANLLNNLINFLEEKKLKLKTINSDLVIETENQKNKIKGINPEEFPIIPKIEKEKICKVDNKILLKAFSQIIEIPSLSSFRPEISGVYFVFLKNQIKIVGTDSFRLAEKNINLEEKIKKEISFILPVNTVKELISILSQKEGFVEIYFSPNQVLFEFPQEEISSSQIQVLSRLIEGEYPKYQEIIPKKYKTRIILKKENFQNLIKQAGLFSGKSFEVKLATQPKENRLKIYSSSYDLGENESYLLTKIEGEETIISFNYRFLLSGLSNINSSEVIFELNGEEGPGVLKPVGDESYIYLLMPIKGS